MSTKKLELENAIKGQGPLGKAHDDEPVFILRAQDVLAPDVVEYWANHAKVIGVNMNKVQEAYQLAADMRRWPSRKTPD